MPNLEFGCNVRDIATGLEGVVVARIEFISGVTEYGIRPKSTDTSRPGVEYVEEPLLEVIDGGITIKPVVKRIGFRVGDS